MVIACVYELIFIYYYVWNGNKRCLCGKFIRGTYTLIVILIVEFNIFFILTEFEMTKIKYGEKIVIFLKFTADIFAGTKYVHVSGSLK